MSFIMVRKVAGLLVRHNWCLEGSFPLVSWFHTDIVETLANVQFGEVLSPTKLGDQLRDQQEQIIVFNRDRIEGMVVLDEPKVSILLFDEEDWGHHQGLGWSDMARV